MPRWYSTPKNSCGRAPHRADDEVEDGNVGPAMGEPAIINSWTRVAMRRIRSFPDEQRLPLLDSISRTTQNAISRARADDWLPVAHTIEVCDALVEALGAERAVEFWRDIVYDSWVGGLLERLGGQLRDQQDEDTARRRNDGVLMLAPAAWTMSARDCGEIIAARNDNGRLQLEARDLPPSVRASEGIRVMYAGALKAMLGFSHLSASVEIVDSDERLAFHLTFK